MDANTAVQVNQSTPQRAIIKFIALPSQDKKAKTTLYIPIEKEIIPDHDKQIVLYDPVIAQKNILQATKIINQREPVQPPPSPPPQQVSNRGPPPALSFVVQCSLCDKWRLMPSKQKYEGIREQVREQPFTCVVAKEWRPEIECDTPGDVEKDESELWAMDRHNIVKTAPGWERDVRIRKEGSTRFADVYYNSPLGKRLRSKVEIKKHLLEHPELTAQGLTSSQFSFKIPKPSNENYVRKRTPRLTVPGDSNLGTPSPLAIEACPLSWALPVDTTNFQFVLTDDVTPPPEKKARPST